MLTSANNLMEYPDEVIQGCVNGDKLSQTKLYNLFAAEMFVVCIRYSANREEAQETLQDGFLKVYQNIHQFKYAGSFEGWIKKIMVNCALNKFRNRSKMDAAIIVQPNEDDFVSDEAIISKLNAKDLLNMIQLLPASCRMVFNLYVFEGLKHHEIAKVLGVSEGTSKSNFSYAKGILKQAVLNSMKQARQNLT